MNHLSSPWSILEHKLTQKSQASQVVFAYDPSTLQVEAGESAIQSHPWLYRKLEPNQSYVRPRLNILLNRQQWQLKSLYCIAYLRNKECIPTLPQKSTSLNITRTFHHFQIISQTILYNRNIWTAITQLGPNKLRNDYVCE